MVPSLHPFLGGASNLPRVTQLRGESVQSPSLLNQILSSFQQVSTPLGGVQRLEASVFQNPTCDSLQFQ